jgi:hypothetical protein
MLNTSGAPSNRSMLTSFVIHVALLGLLLLIPTEAWRRTPPRRQVDIVFHKAPEIKIPVPAALMPQAKVAAPAGNAGAPAPAAKPKPQAPPGPDKPGNPELPVGPGEGYPTQLPTPQQRVGNVGILALKDKFASLSKARIAPRLGADARFGAADDVGNPASSRSLLTSNNPGSSGGINVASLSRTVGGGGGGGGGGTGGGGAGGLQGLGVGKATSSIASIGGGDRPLSHGGPGPSRTDEEIQIVFDRYKAQFYRQYNRALRNDPTLKGQMVLRLTIEPDGSVSMCKLQSSDMNAPELAEQVVNITRTINFGAKEGVQALTISYPIDFLPAE